MLGYVANYGLPLLILAGIVLLFWGIIRYFVSIDPAQKHNGVVLMMSGLGAFGAVIVLWIMMSMFGSTYYGVSTNVVMPSGMRAMEDGSTAGYATTPEASIAPMPPMMDYGYGYNGGTPAATDTREFNKIYYTAEMRTRSVQELTRHAETTVRGSGGRVDRTSSSEKYGSISFVVPADKFDQFRDELEAFVDPRFLKVDIGSENLLPQKQNIEQNQKSAQETIDDYKKQRQQLVASHSASVKSIQSRIAADQAEINAINSQPIDPSQSAVIAARLNALSSSIASLNSSLSRENSSYKNSLASIDANISYAEQRLDNANDQNQDLLDNVATVNGTVSFRWIGLWEMAHGYLPGPWIPGIIAVLAVAAYWWERRRA